MPKSSWWKKDHLWDTLCAAWQEGMGWLLGTVKKSTGLASRQRTRRARKLQLALELEALERRFAPTLSALSITTTPNANGYGLVRETPSYGDPEYTGPSFGDDGWCSFTDTVPVTSYDLSATVTWGDGTTSTISGGISDLPVELAFIGTDWPYNEQWVLHFNHNSYNEAGTYTYSISVSDGSSTSSITSTLDVSDAQITATVGLTTPVEGQRITDWIGSIHDPNPYEPASEYSAAVDWGDGTWSYSTGGTDPLTLEKISLYDVGVTGTHTYLEETGPDEFRDVWMYASEIDGTSDSAHWQIAVSDAPLHETQAPPTLSLREETPWTGTLVRFTDDNPLATSADYSINVAWGDGSSGTVGTDLTLSHDVADGYWEIRGTHFYEDEVTSGFLSVGVFDEGGSSLYDGKGVVVADADLHPGKATKPFVTISEPFHGEVFHFTDLNPYATEADFNTPGFYPVIAWGDGTYSSDDEDANVVASPEGGFDLIGSHIYKDQVLNGHFWVKVYDDGGSWTHAGLVDEGDEPIDINIVEPTPFNELLVPVGEATIGMNAGSVRISQALDFDLNPGNAVGGAPALAYNSQTAHPIPIIKIWLPPPDVPELPSSILVRLTWQGNLEDAYSYNSFTDISASDTIVVAIPVHTPISDTENYYWSMHVTINYAVADDVDEYFTGQTPVVLNDGPLGNGWGIVGIDRLIAVSNGVIYLHGNGDYEYFADAVEEGEYTSPYGDFGTLVGAPDSSFTYTTPEGTILKFDGDGNLTANINRDHLTLSYFYDDDHRILVVNSPDGVATTFTYPSDGEWTISEPGSRTFTANLDDDNNVTLLTDVDSTQRTLAYATGTTSGTNLLENDQWAPYNATFSYGAENNVTEVVLGLGTTYGIDAARVQGICPYPVPDSRQGRATFTDPLTHGTVDTLDIMGRRIAMTDALNESQIW